MLKNKYNKGFTLIEIVAILILIGILMAVAASKYFDMRDEAQKRAALATVAEAQSRINSVFAEKILSGQTCAQAKAYASNLENIEDGNDPKDFDFGDYYLTKNDESSTDSTISVGVGLISETSGREITTATLYLPECGSKNGGTEGGGTTGDYWKNNDYIIDLYGNTEYVPQAGRPINNIIELASALIDVFSNPGSIFEVNNAILASDGTVILDAGYYVYDRGFLNPQIIKLDADKPENWVKYEDGEWNRELKRGDYFLDQNGKVHIYKGSDTNPSPPSGGIQDRLNWLEPHSFK